jgi:hypothetical protein
VNQDVADNADYGEAARILIAEIDSLTQRVSIRPKFSGHGFTDNNGAFVRTLFIKAASVVDRERPAF